MGKAGAGAWWAHDATPPRHDPPRRRAVQHHGDRRVALAHDGWSDRAGEPRAVGDRDGDLLPAVGDGSARAHGHRPRGRGHLPLGNPGVRPASRVSRRLGLLGEQPRLLPVAPAHERRDRGLRRGGGFVHLAENKWFIAAFSLGNLWIAVGLNLVGLRVGKWAQNLGAYGTWLPAAIFVLLALWSFATHGSATPFTAAALVPAHLDLPLLSLFAT